MKTFATLLVTAVAVQAAAIAPRDDDSGAPNFASVEAQPQPTITGPTAGAAQQTNTINAAQASNTGSAAATATSGPNKRTFCWGPGSQWWPWCPQPNPKTSTPWGQPTTKPWGQPTTQPWGQPTTKPWGQPTTSPWGQPTTSPWGQPTTTAPTWSKPATCTSTPYTPYYPATSTVTPSQTGTVSSGSACPTQPEAGTYCGFINPEDPCAPQPDGYGPVPKPDTPDAFKNDPEWTADAEGALAPAGYTRVFTNLNGSVSAANYLGLHTLKKYDVNACASACQCTEGCTAFNLFIERDPSLNPTDNDNSAPSVWGHYCPNPASMTSFKCTLWGGPISAADATNYGQTREQFQVLIAGSNGYNAQPETAPPAPQPGWGNGHHCGGGGIWDPNHQMGGHFFPGPFDVRICAAYAEAQTLKNHDACPSGGHYDACNFWNAYGLTKNGRFWGMYCALFTDKPANAEGNYTGGFSAGFDWEVEWSWSQYHGADSWNSGIKN